MENHSHFVCPECDSLSDITDDRGQAFTECGYCGHLFEESNKV